VAAARFRLAARSCCAERAVGLVDGPAVVERADPMIGSVGALRGYSAVRLRTGLPSSTDWRVAKSSRTIARMLINIDRSIT